MKSFFLIALLAAFAACLDAAAVPSKSNPPIVTGTIQPGDWVIIRGETTLRPEPDTVVTKKLRYTLGAQYKVTAVELIEQGPPQGGFPAFIGGVGTNDVTVVLQSARGRGYAYTVRLWGHDTTGEDTGPNQPTLKLAQW